MPRTNSSNWSANAQITAARLQDFNEDIDDLYLYGTDRGRVRTAISGTDLRIDIGAHAWRVGTAMGQYAGATDVVVTNTATNYVEIDSSGVIAINTSGWTDTNARLATVTCSGGVVTAVSLWKADVVGGQLGGGNATVLDKTAAYTILTSDSGKIITNRGATTPITMTLPAAAAGLSVTIVAITDLIEVKLASGDEIHRPLNVGTITASAWLFTTYGPLELICLDATEWVARSGDSYMLTGKGYVVGGHTGGGEGATVASYEYIDFADDTSVAAGISIASNRAGMAGNDYTFKAFTLGGWNVSSADQSIIDRITFATSTVAVATAVATPTLDTARSWPAGCESSTNGYLLGGADRDAGTFSTTVSKLAFVAETEANSGSTIAAGRGYNGGISSPTAGYSLGGQNAGNQSAIYKIVFSTDTTSTPAATLSTATSLMATNECRTNGYKMGGDSNTTVIAKFLFSSDTRSDLAATLDTGTSQNIGVSGGKGYTAGGGVSTRIEDLNFAAETSAALAATLDTARSAAAGVNPAFR